MFKHILIPTDGSTIALKAAKAAMRLAAQNGAARKRNCDLIWIASHGRRGVARLMVGSVTLKVLAHATVPVLVYR